MRLRDFPEVRGHRFCGQTTFAPCLSGCSEGEIASIKDPFGLRLLTYWRTEIDLFTLPDSRRAGVCVLCETVLNTYIHSRDRLDRAYAGMKSRSSLVKAIYGCNAGPPPPPSSVTRRPGGSAIHDAAIIRIQRCSAACIWNDREVKCGAILFIWHEAKNPGGGIPKRKH
ncbi:hypothetical protein LY78DRAFT_652719 [Colletotrichum sublineola]|nr:hypothetical protein LY78DRAFT_652719 [Colletotrichum sublineola]